MTNRRSSYGSIYIEEETYQKSDYGHRDAFSDQETMKYSDHDSMPPGISKPSNKVQSLVNDVLATEKRCEFLTERNAWLTARLLQSQKGFIARMLTSSSGEKKRRVFDVWHKMMAELRLEKQLYEMGKSCERLQDIGREASKALEKEQQLKDKAEMALAKADEELRRIGAENANLRRQIEADTRRMALLERRLSEAETTIFRSRKDAQGVMEAVTNYEETREFLDKQATGPVEPSTLEQSLQIRQEASGTIDRISGVLGRRFERDDSPTVAPTRMVSQASPMFEAATESMPMTRVYTMSSAQGQPTSSVPLQPRSQYIGAQPSAMTGGQYVIAREPQVRNVGRTNAYATGVPTNMPSIVPPGPPIQAFAEMPTYVPTIVPPGTVLGATTPISSRSQSPMPGRY